jgi:hypothetical protein
LHVPSICCLAFMWSFVHSSVISISAGVGCCKYPRIPERPPSSSLYIQWPCFTRNFT